MLREVVILADDSARWKVAGLRQLERLALELNAIAALRAERIKCFILWSPAISPRQRFVPQHPQLVRLLFVTTPPRSLDLLLSTRLFLRRNSSAIPEPHSKPSPNLSQSFSQLFAEVQAAWQSSGQTEAWEYLESCTQIPACEKRFLRGSGKSQDGLVSRFINRPISRALSRVLLQTPITPSAWTLAIFILPLFGATLLARGDYGSVVGGLLFFQLYSILDGCDGEIARAKYLESPRGRRLDTWCDTIGNLLMVVSLGYGLAHQPTPAPFYLAEGIFVALLIATNEFILAALNSNAGRTPAGQVGEALYPRHQQMVARSGLLFFGDRLTWWLIQLTKRDVALVAFLLLALAGRPGWILHLLGAVAALSSLLAWRSLRRPPLIR